MSPISETSLREVIDFRRELHAYPELSGEECQTAERARQFLERHKPDEIHTAVGGHGVLAVFDSGAPGPVVVFRCELDALPIDEPNQFNHRSTRPGVSHKCGHDGHMATLAGLAGVIRDRGLPRGKVALLFQPAEESGEGAKAVLGDARFRALAPDFIFAFHNLPKFPLHRVIVRDGVFACASVGMVVEFTGSSTHSSYPEHGRSPAPAVARLIESLAGLGESGATDGDLLLVTVTQAQVGDMTHKIDFGVAPATGRVIAVLRAERQAVLDSLKQRAQQLAEKLALEHGLEIEVCWREEFASTSNDPQAVAFVRDASRRAGLEVGEAVNPFRWSEDFGLFLQEYPGAIFGLGSGEDQPQLHNEGYDYPDTLISTGILVFWTLIEQLLTPTSFPPPSSS